MRFSDRKARVRYIEKRDKHTQWHSYFAWLPVEIVVWNDSIPHRVYAWLEHVERKMTPTDTGVIWQYRLKEL